MKKDKNDRVVKDIVSGTKKQTKNLQKMRDDVWLLVGKYQDKSKRYNHILKAWVEYLVLYHELEEANSHEGVGILDIIGWDKMQIMQNKMKAVEDSIKELLRFGDWKH